MSNVKMLTFLGLISVTVACSYLPENPETSDFLANETADYIHYSSGNANNKALLFIPGGLVDPHVYQCWINLLIEKQPDVDIVVPKLPSNLAIVNSKQIRKVKDQFENVQHWVVGGHSLGGVVAAQFVADNTSAFDGLILMASWTLESNNLSGWTGSVLSLYGSDDAVATVAEIESYEAFLPPKVELDTPVLPTDIFKKNMCYLIQGANHSGFGCYGLQNGDNEADISQEQQHEIISDLMAEFFKVLWNLN